MSSDAKDAKTCYTKAGVRAAPIKYGAFLFLLFGGSSECSAQGNLKYFTCAACSTNLSRKYNFGSRNVIGNNINLPLHKKDYKSTV